MVGFGHTSWRHIGQSRWQQLRSSVVHRALCADIKTVPNRPRLMELTSQSIMLDRSNVGAYAGNLLLLLFSLSPRIRARPPQSRVIGPSLHSSQYDWNTRRDASVYLTVIQIELPIVLVKADKGHPPRRYGHFLPALHPPFDTK